MAEEDRDYTGGGSEGRRGVGEDPAGMETMTALHDVAERVSRGDVLSESDAQIILETDDIVSVGMLADEARRQRHGTRTTFVRVHEIHVASPSSPLPPRVHAGEFRIIG